MAIKVADNTEKIKAVAKQFVQEIEENANHGIPTTDIYVEKHIGMDVRREIESILDADETKYTWVIVSRGINQFTGATQYFTGETIGDEKHYKIKILS